MSNSWSINGIGHALGIREQEDAYGAYLAGWSEEGNLRRIL